MRFLYFLRISIVCGHGLMVVPKARAGTTNAGLSKGLQHAPCGSGPQLQKAGEIVATYAEGGEMTVAWQTDIEHGGTCRISLALDGGGEPGPVDAQGRLDSSDPANGIYTVTPDFPCCRARGAESITIKLPEEVKPGNYVLQWFWDGDDGYFNCADIAVATGAVADGMNAALLETNGIGTGLTNLPSDHLLVGCSTFAQGCNNHGTCGSDDKCQCDEGYFGADCQMYYMNRETVGMLFTVDAKMSDFSSREFRTAVANVIEVDMDRLRVLDVWEASEGGTNVYVAIRSGGHSSSDTPDKWSPYSAGHLVKARLEDGRLNQEFQNVAGYNVTTVDSAPCAECSNLETFLTLSFLALIVMLACAFTYLCSDRLVQLGYLPASILQAMTWLCRCVDAICFPCDNCRTKCRPRSDECYDEDEEGWEEKKKPVEEKKKPASEKSTSGRWWPKKKEPTENDEASENNAAEKNTSRSWWPQKMGPSMTTSSSYKPQKNEPTENDAAEKTTAEKSTSRSWWPQRKKPPENDVENQKDKTVEADDNVAKDAPPAKKSGMFSVTSWRKTPSTKSNENNPMAPKWQKSTSGSNLMNIQKENGPASPRSQEQSSNSTNATEESGASLKNAGEASSGPRSFRMPVPPWMQKSSAKAESTKATTRNSPRIEEDEVYEGDMPEKTDFQDSPSKKKEDFKKKFANMSFFGGLKLGVSKKKGEDDAPNLGERKSFSTQADDGTLRMVVPYEERNELEEIFYDFCFPNDIPMEVVKAYSADGTLMTGDEDPRSHEDWWPISFVYNPKDRPVLAATRTIDSWE